MICDIMSAAGTKLACPAAFLSEALAALSTARPSSAERIDWVSVQPRWDRPFYE